MKYIKMLKNKKITIDQKNKHNKYNIINKNKIQNECS